jgi:RNA polymerase sigma factor (sigma-70 family)
VSRLRDSAFEQCFQTHAESLFAFLVYRTGDRVLAEDLVAETFERVLRSRNRFDPRRGSEKNWIYTIAVNLVRDQARKRTVETRALERVGGEPSHEPDDGGIGAIDDRDALAHALDTLSDDEREAIALRFGADAKVRDVARMVGESESAVEKRIQRGLQKLRQQLQ